MTPSWLEIILLIVCVVIPVLWFFAVPLLIYQTQRLAANPEITRVENESELPEPVRKYFFAAYETLTSLGFTHEGTYYMPAPADNIRCIVNGYVQRGDHATALVAAVYVKTEISWSLQARFTAFETRYANGTSIESSNQPSVGSFPKPAGSRLLLHPDLENPATLYRAHLIARESLAGSHRPINAIDETFHGDAMAMLTRDVQDELAGAATMGYLQLDGSPVVSPSMSEINPSLDSRSSGSPYQPPSDLAAGANYRPTFRGAYLMTWKELWPLKSILLWRRARKDRRLIEEAGFVT